MGFRSDVSDPPHCLEKYIANNGVELLAVGVAVVGILQLGHGKPRTQVTHDTNIYILGLTHQSINQSTNQPTTNHHGKYQQVLLYIHMYVCPNPSNQSCNMVLTGNDALLEIGNLLRHSFERTKVKKFTFLC